MSCRLRLTVLIALLIVAAHPASGKELENLEWIEVRTTNFRIFSVLSEEDSIELARYLEMFRAAVSIVMNVSFNDSPIPTEIYALRRGSDLTRLGIYQRYGGRYLFGLRANRVVILDPHDMGETSVNLREYVHFLARNHGRSSYPRWFDEGLAHYLGRGHTNSREYVIGDAQAYLRYQRGYLGYYSLSSSQWIPLRKILSPAGFDGWSDEHKAAYYEEAWALVHYLQHRPERGTLLGQDMMHYVELVESGKSDVEAFEATFMISVMDLDSKVKRYFRKRQVPNFYVKINDVLPDFEPDVISLSREQASLALAQVALVLGELDKAERWFTIAAKDEVARPRAEAGLGDVLKFGGNFEAAQPHFEQAVALAPNDPYCQLDIAEYWYTRAKNSSDTGDRETYLARAREHFVKAWKLDNSIPETYAVYGETFMMEGQNYDFAIEMLEQAEHLLPSSIRVHAMLAEAYMGADRKEDAVEAARLVLAWGDEESDEAKKARKVLDSVAAGREPDQDES